MNYIDVWKSKWFRDLEKIYYLFQH